MKQILVYSFIFAAAFGTRSLGFRCAHIKHYLGMPLDCVSPKPIGTGATATVYRVVDADKNHYAAKVMFFETEEQKRGRKLVEREEEILRKVDQPNVIKLKKSFVADDLIIFLLEFGARGTLSQFFKDNPEFKENPVFVQQTFRGIALGVMALHEIGLAVADLKEDNVVLMDDFTPKIIDLGYAMELNVPYNYACGTRTHMDPRLLLRPAPYIYDKKNDVYAWGTMLLGLYRDPSDPSVRTKLELKKEITGKDFVLRDRVELTIFELIENCRMLDANLRPSFEMIVGSIDLNLLYGGFRFVKQTVFGNKRGEESRGEMKLYPETYSLKYFQDDLERLKVKLEIKLKKDRAKKGAHNWGWLSKLASRKRILAQSQLVGSGIILEPPQHAVCGRERIFRFLLALGLILGLMLTAWLLAFKRRNQYSKEKTAISGAGIVQGTPSLDEKAGAVGDIETPLDTQGK